MEKFTKRYWMTVFVTQRHDMSISKDRICLDIHSLPELRLLTFNQYAKLFYSSLRKIGRSIRIYFNLALAVKESGQNNRIAG